MQLPISSPPSRRRLRLARLSLLACAMLAGLCGLAGARPVAEPSLGVLRAQCTHAAIFRVVKVGPSAVPGLGSPHPEPAGYVAHSARCEVIMPVEGEMPKEFSIRFFVYEKPAFNGSVCAFLELFEGSSFLGFLKADPDAPGEFMACMGHLDEGLAFRLVDPPLIQAWMAEVQKRKAAKYQAKQSQDP